jgi:predicted N-formylglutamate amidohydrolase
MNDEAVERIAATTSRPPILLSAEHASERLPPGWSWPASDARLAGTHWAYDLGIADITRAVAAALGAPAVLSRFSRLLIDPNRPLDSDTLFRREADGLPVGLNAALTPADRERRIDTYYRPYHDALAEMVAAHPGVNMLSLHSFTPCYEGQRRTVEVGVLFDLHEAWAERWYGALSVHGWVMARNAPWSGRNGLMYAVQHHAVQHGRQAVELELRQDLTTDPDARQRLVDGIVAAVRALGEEAPASVAGARHA